MWHKISTFIFLFLFFASFAHSQNNLKGIWEGMITMEREGKTIQSFRFVIQIDQDSIELKGQSWVWYNELKASFEISGEFKNNQLTLKDVKLIDADSLPSGEWCEKIMQLSIMHNKKMDKLEGIWQGKTTFSQCTPGKVVLKKNTDRV